jgi:hypothetical protein
MTIETKEGAPLRSITVFFEGTLVCPPSCGRFIKWPADNYPGNDDGDTASPKAAAIQGRPEGSVLFVGELNLRPACWASMASARTRRCSLS